MISAIALSMALSSVPASAAEGGAAPDDRDDVEALQEHVDALAAENRALRAQMERIEQALDTHDPVQRIAYGDVHVAEGERVTEAISLSDDVVVDGFVQGNAVSLGGSVRLGPRAHVGGDVVAMGGQLIVADGAVVGGNRFGLPASDATPPPTPPPPIDPRHATGALAMVSQASHVLDAFYQRLVLLLSVAGAGVLTIGLVPHRVARVAADVEERPLRSAIVGVLGPGFLAVFAGLFVLITQGVASPVGLVAMAGLAAAWLLGFVGFCQALGDRIPLRHKHHGRWLVFLVGVLFISFMSSLPWMGWVVMLGVSVMGTGSALATRFGSAST